MRTAHYNIQLDVTNSDRFLNLSERPIPAKVLLERERRSLVGQNGNFFCHLGFSVWWRQATALSSSVTLRVLNVAHVWISQQDCYFLCRLLTGYSKIKDFWSNVLPHFTKCSLNGPLLWVLWRNASTRDMCTALSCNSITDSFEPPVTVGQQLFCLVNDCAKNVRLQNYETLNQKYYPHYFYPLVLYQMPSSKGTVTCR